MHRNCGRRGVTSRTAARDARGAIARGVHCLGVLGLVITSVGCSPDGGGGPAPRSQSSAGGFAIRATTGGSGAAAGQSNTISGGLAGVGALGQAGTGISVVPMTGIAGRGTAPVTGTAGRSGVGGGGTAAVGVAAMAGAPAPGSIAPTPDTVCTGTATAAPGAQMTVMLADRQYLLHVGKAVKPGQAAPLVFSLHGLTMTPSSMESMAHWFPLADTKGFIVAGPAGVGASNGWDLTSTKDFDLMKAVVEDVNKKVCVDRKRIYSTGFSHGAFMSHSNGCKLSDVFAAIAPHSGALGGACSPKRPMPVYAWHGDADATVSYSSGKSAVDGWVTRNKCTGTPTDYMVSAAKCQEWATCQDGVKVKFCTIPGGGHAWYGPATAAIWDFFAQNAMP
jgi:polyhydroxybutyrate depolymerase